MSVSCCKLAETLTTILIYCLIYLPFWSLHYAFYKWVSNFTQRRTVWIHVVFWLQLVMTVYHLFHFSLYFLLWIVALSHNARMFLSHYKSDCDGNGKLQWSANTITWLLLGPAGHLLLSFSAPLSIGNTTVALSLFSPI